MSGKKRGIKKGHSTNSLELKIISSSSKIIYICLSLLGKVIYIVRVTKVRDKGGSAEKDGNVLGSGNVVLVMLRRVDCTLLL